MHPIQNGLSVSKSLHRKYLGYCTFQSCILAEAEYKYVEFSASQTKPEIGCKD